MAKYFGLIALVLCACLAASAVAEQTGDSASRRLLNNYKGSIKIAAVDICAGVSGDKVALIQCCYKHTSDLSIIVKIVVGFGYEDCTEDYVKVVLKITVSGRPYTGPGGRWYDHCKNRCHTKEEAILCCREAVFPLDIELIVKIVIGFGFTDCTEDYVKIVLKIDVPVKYTGPSGLWYDHCKNRCHTKEEAILCCREVVKPLDVKLIVQIVIGFGFTDCTEDYVIIVLKIKVPGHPHRPTPPAHCGPKKHNPWKYVWCCKEAGLPPPDILDVCIQVGIKGVTLPAIVAQKTDPPGP